MWTKKAASLGGALLAGGAAAVLAASPAAAAVVADVSVTNTETVQAYMDATGELDVARIYDQIAMQGNGTVELANPVSTEGLRNLDKFGGFDVQDGEIVGTYDVDGQMRLRAVSDFTQKLPLDVKVTYLLDGNEVSPEEIVGATGSLEVRYVVRNVTGKQQEVSFDDGTGTMTTASEDVVIPMVGSLTTVLPPSFTNVASNQANKAGDGRGGTKMSFTMTLFGPIGAPEAAFGYTASIANGLVPPATITALPVNPLESPSFKGGAASYQSGAVTGVTLTAGATQIDENLLKLRDGAGELLAGLIKLSVGANQLNAGLTGTAAPGAVLLADGADKAASGASQLSGGVTQLDDGANKLSGGASQVAGGADSAAAGSSKLATGASALSDGIAQILAGVEALPNEVAKDPDFIRLKGALSGIQAGIGDPADVGSTTLLGGLNQLKYGLRSPVGVSNCDQSKATTTIADDCGAADGTEIVAAKLDGAVPVIGALGDKAVASYIAAGCPQNPAVPVPPVVPSSSLPSPPVPQICKDLSDVAYGLLLPAGLLPAPNDLGGLEAQTALAAATLTTIFQGLDAKAIPGIDAIKKGLSNPGCDPTVTDKTSSAYCGISQAAGLVSAGIDTLVKGISDQLVVALEQAAAGSTELAAGANTLNAGLGTLAGGAGQVSDGASQLADGTAQAADGADKLAAGNELLAVGANKLATGLTGAADGASQIAQGLDQAAEGAPALEDGAQRLSDEGTSQLVVAGKATAADYGLKYATIEAGAERANAEAMAIGAPEGAAGTTAYSIELAGVDSASTRNMGRLLAAAAIFAMAAGAVVLLRRRAV